MKSKVLAISLVMLVIAFSCDSPGESKANLKKEQLKFSATKTYLKNNCISCHSETAGESERLAPPFYAIRKHYLNEYESEEQFVSAMSDFLKHPQKDHALMQGAVEKFGLMPPLSYPEGKLEEIATYLYHKEQPKPKHLESEEGPIAKGKKLAMATKKVLGKNLMGALQDSGKYYALSFCNLKAIDLTDSMSDYLGYSIARRSDKARNPANQANEMELEILESFRKDLAVGNQPKGKLKEMEGQSMAYYPILTNAMCLQCHGRLGKDLDPEFYNQVKELYPNDQAISYSANQLRGIWVVQLGPSN